MYTKGTYKKCIPHFNKLLHTLCIQNLAAMALLILYTECIQKFVEMWYTYCIHFVYISCIQLLYTSVASNFCIQNVHTISVWMKLPVFTKLGR